MEFRSAFEGYRPHAEAEPRDWRKSNDAVGAARGHTGHQPAKPAKPENPESPHQGHGRHR